jgi:2,4-dienoyl-CoA reductase-like NADH-dependent reductase (Old Yellow Enzyme family)
VRARKYFFLAVNTGYVSKGLPDDRCYSFYADRSGHGLYCTIVGNVVIPNGVGTNDVCAYISSSPRWRTLARAIADRGALPGMQLSSTWFGFRGNKRFRSRSHEGAMGAYKAVLAEVPVASIRAVLDDLRRGTELSLAAGFRHVQLHAGHGYLFSLLLDFTFCRHSDIVLQFLHDWTKQIARAGAESSLRFSLLTGDRETDDGRCRGLVETLLKLPFDYFDITNGFYNINKQLIYPTSKELLESRRLATLAVAERFPLQQIILSGKSTGAWEPGLPSNVHIGICRDLIANPCFLRDRASGCSNCMRCHYYSLGKLDLACGRWTSA